MSLRVSEVHARPRQRPWALALALLLLLFQAGLTLRGFIGNDTDNRFAWRMFSDYATPCEVKLQAFGGPRPMEVVLRDRSRTGAGPMERFRKKWCRTLSSENYAQVLVTVCDDAPPYLEDLAIRPYFCDEFR